MRVFAEQNVFETTSYFKLILGNKNKPEIWKIKTNFVVVYVSIYIFIYAPFYNQKEENWWI